MDRRLHLLNRIAGRAYGDREARMRHSLFILLYILGFALIYFFSFFFIAFISPGFTSPMQTYNDFLPCGFSDIVFLTSSFPDTSILPNLFPAQEELLVSMVWPLYCTMANLYAICCRRCICFRNPPFLLYIA